MTHNPHTTPPFPLRCVAAQTAALRLAALRMLIPNPRASRRRGFWRVDEGLTIDGSGKYRHNGAAGRTGELESRGLLLGLRRPLKRARWLQALHGVEGCSPQLRGLTLDPLLELAFALGSGKSMTALLPTCNRRLHPLLTLGGLAAVPGCWRLPAAVAGAGLGWLGVIGTAPMIRATWRSGQCGHAPVSYHAFPASFMVICVDISRARGTGSGQRE